MAVNSCSASVFRPVRALVPAAAGTVTQRSGTAIRRPWAGPPAHFCPAGSAEVGARGLLTEAYMACYAWVDRLPPLAQPVMARTRPAASADTGSRAGIRLISDPPGGAAQAPGEFRAPGWRQQSKSAQGSMRPNGSLRATG